MLFRHIKRAAANAMPWGAGARSIRSFCVALVSLLLLPQVAAADLVETLRRIKPSIVAVGTYQATRRPPALLLATGFVVSDGNHVATNAHAIPASLNGPEREKLVVFIRRGTAIERRSVTQVIKDEAHDLAILRITGPAISALRLAGDGGIQEGQSVAFTGFPIGAVLGLYPATHRGIVAAIVPIGNPQVSVSELDSRMIRQLSQPFPVFQLDATAYPGNSGSPLYDPETGSVLGIVSSVFVKATKERVLQDPSGITYAIPVSHLRSLLQENGLAP